MYSTKGVVTCYSKRKEKSKPRLSRHHNYTKVSVDNELAKLEAYQT